MIIKKDSFIRTLTASGTPVTIRISSIDLFYKEGEATIIVLKDGTIISIRDNYGDLNKLI